VILNKDLVLYFEQAYWKTGALPSYEVMVADGVELSQDEYNQHWEDPQFKALLEARGVPKRLLGTGTTLSAYLLTEQQMTVANALLDVLDSRSRLKKLTEFGISTGTYNTWLRDPVYRAYCLDRAESLLVENQPVAHMSLINRVSQGDLGAVKYFNAMTGRYRERERAAVEINTVNQYGSDKLIAIVEIIQKHVKDPAVLEAIASDILALNTGAVTGAALSEPLGQNRDVYSITSAVEVAREHRPI
jgi:hypothetical protein